MKFSANLIFLISINQIIKLIDSSKHRYPKSISDIKNKQYTDEEIYEFFMYAQTDQFETAVGSDKVYKHLTIKDGKLPFDSLIGQANDNQTKIDQIKKKDYYNYKHFDMMNETEDNDENDENDENDQMARSSSKLTQNLFIDESKFNIFNFKDKRIEAKNYLANLKKINFDELSAILRATLIYIRTPIIRQFLDVGKFVIQTIKKIFKQIEMRTVLFELENGIYTRISCVICMTFFNIFRNPIFYPFSTEKIVNLVCLLRLSNPTICNSMAENFSKTFGYIRMNSLLTVEETCGSLIGNQCLVENTNKLNWTVFIPPLINKNYRNLIDVSKIQNGQQNRSQINDKKNSKEFKLESNDSDENTEKTFYVGVVTDIHIDPYYLYFSNATCFEPVCCRKQILNRTRFNNVIFKQLTSSQKPSDIFFQLPFSPKSPLNTRFPNFEQDLRNMSINLQNLTLNIGKKIFELASISGIFGDYNLCDTPPITFQLVLENLVKFKINDFNTIDIDSIDNQSKLKSTIDLNSQLNYLNNTPHLDYVVFGGDIPAHDFWRQTKSSSIKFIEEATNSIHKYLPLTPIIPVIGNHETVPINAFAPDFSDLDGAEYEIDLNRYFYNSTSKQVELNQTHIQATKDNKLIKKSIDIDIDLTSDWLYSQAAKSWSIFLPDSALDTLRKTGSYVLNRSKNFRLIMINTNYCARINFWNWYDSVDPGNQLKFLVKELFEAENQNQYVHIIGHVGPDHLECTQAWLNNYIRILHRFKHVIKAQFFGHTHKDEHRLYYSNLEYQKELFDKLNIRGSGLEPLFERDLVKIGPIKPSPTHTPVSSATSSTFEKIKRTFVKIKNSLRKRFFNWRSAKENEPTNNRRRNIGLSKRKINDLLTINEQNINQMNNNFVASSKVENDSSKIEKEFQHVLAGFALITPSVTSYSKTNPAYRIYAIGEESGRILDYNTFFFNLTEAKLQSFKLNDVKDKIYEPTWNIEYSAREEYKEYLGRDQGRFTENAFHLLQEKLIQNEDAFAKFYRKFYVQSDAKEALSFDQTIRNMILQNSMVRDPYKVWPTRFDELFAY